MRLQNLMKFNHCLFKLLRKTQTQELARSHYFSIINVHLVDINMFAKFYEIPSLPFKDIENPKRRERTDGGIDGRMDVKKVYIPPRTCTVCAGGGGERGKIEDFKLW